MILGGLVVGSSECCLEEEPALFVIGPVWVDERVETLRLQDPLVGTELFECNRLDRPQLGLRVLCDRPYNDATVARIFDDVELTVRHCKPYRCRGSAPRSWTTRI